MKQTILILSMIFISFVAQAIEITLNYDSYGPIKFGEKIKDVEALLKEKAIKNKYAESGCYYVKFKIFPNVDLMVEEGVVKRAEIRINTPTILNIPASSKLENIKSKYPKVQIQQHKYAPNGYYLIFNNANNTKAIVYEYYEDQIQDIRAGLKPAVHYVEGCS